MRCGGGVGAGGRANKTGVGGGSSVNKNKCRRGAELFNLKDSGLALVK